MRRDMQDVLKDRRYRRYEQEKYWTRARVNRAIPDDLPTTISHGRSWTYSSGDTNPLENFLHSKLGELWDDVYSEICEVTDRRSERGRYLFKELGWMVELNFYEHWWRGSGFFVDCDGILRFRGRDNYVPKPALVTKLPIDETTWYELVDGCWFWVERASAEDEWLSYWRLIGVTTREYDNTTKRQVGKRTLKKIRKILRGE